MTEFGWMYLINLIISVPMCIIQLFINLKCKSLAAKLTIPAIVMVPTILIVMMYFGAFGRSDWNFHQLVAIWFAIGVAILWVAEAIAWILYFVIQEVRKRK